MFKKLIQKFKAMNDQDDYNSGYEWASSYIKEGKLSQVEDLTYNVNDWFDRGARAAIRNVRRHKNDTATKLRRVTGK